jgi:hypothetical protein
VNFLKDNLQDLSNFVLSLWDTVPGIHKNFNTVWVNKPLQMRRLAVHLKFQPTEMLGCRLAEHRKMFIPKKLRRVFKRSGHDR